MGLHGTAKYGEYQLHGHGISSVERKAMRYFGRLSFVFLIALLVAISVVHTQGVPHFNALSWTLSTTPGVTSQKIYRGTASTGPFTLLATIADGTTTSYQDASTTAGVQHWYVMTALVGAQESVFSATPATGGADVGTNVNPQTGQAVTNH